MAKGNIGNLLQHFVALHVAKRLVEECSNPPASIEYIDCFAMEPWEDVEGGQPQGFVDVVRSFPARQQQGDLVARVFLGAWVTKYGLCAVPPEPTRRQYPNSAVLLRNGFPEQHFHMRLCESDNDKRANLTDWVAGQALGTYEVHGEWQPSVLKHPASADRAVFVMLDPDQIVANDQEQQDSRDLNETQLKFLCGGLGLNLRERPNGSPPVIMTLFSYSDANPEAAARIVNRVCTWGDTVERIQIGPWHVHGHPAYHLAFVVAKGLRSPIFQPSAQAAWDSWRNG